MQIANGTLVIPSKMVFEITPNIYPLLTGPISNPFDSSTPLFVQFLRSKTAEQTCCSSYDFERFLSRSRHEIYYTLRVESVIWQIGTKGLYSLMKSI